VLFKTDFVTDSPRMWTFDPENLQEIASFHCLLTIETVRKPRETNTSKTWFSTFFLFFFLQVTLRVTFRQIGVCSSFSCRLSATVTKRHAKGGSQKTPKSTKSRFFFEFLLFVPVGLRCTKTPHLRLFLWNECDKIWVCQPKWSTTIMSPWDCQRAPQKPRQQV
jgi:hypothetical protein